MSAQIPPPQPDSDADMSLAQVAFLAGFASLSGFPTYTGADSAPDDGEEGLKPGQRIVIVGPDNQVLGTTTHVPNEGQIAAAVAQLDEPSLDGEDEKNGEAATVSGKAGKPEGKLDIADAIEEPAKVMRIGSMVKQLLDEVKSAPLDVAGRTRMREIHATSIKELESGLSSELVAELHRLNLPFSEDSVPSEAELRIAQAQLVGWLEGLFHGLQTAIIAQQMSARAQMEQGLRRALPGGDDHGPTGVAPGQYL